MKVRKMLLSILVLPFLILCLYSCDGINNINPDKPDGPGAIDSINEISTIQLEEIEWFNTVTKEIRFKNIEPAKNSQPYKLISFKLNDEVLFSAEPVYPTSSKAIFDLVLYIQHENDYRYYLHDGYPIWAAEYEEAKENSALRAENWNKFLNYLRNENRLREYDDSDPGIGNPDPYIYISPYTNIGDIEATRFIQKASWNFINLDINKLNIIRNEDELKKLITENSYAPSEIDFEKNSLLLVRVFTFNCIEHIYYGLAKDGKNEYHYSLKVLMNMAEAIGDEIFAVLTPVIDINETIYFDIKISHIFEDINK